MVLVIYSCGTKTPVASTAPEIDFTSANYFKPSEMRNYKGSLECNGTTPYWEGKMTKLQGFIFSGNVDTTNKNFFLYDDINIKSPTNANSAVIVYYQSKDSATISKALLDNKDKHAIMRVTCFSGQAIINGCERFIKFTITKPEDLEFK